MKSCTSAILAGRAQLEVDFSGSKTINEIDVFTRQDNLDNPTEPTLMQTFSQYGITAFDVQYWDGTAWTNVPRSGFDWLKRRPPSKQRLGELPLGACVCSARL